VRVLVVEDNPGDARLVALYLEESRRWGFEVATANTFAEATSRAEAEAPDVVLLDLTLPDGEGLGLFRRASEALAAPLILVTGREDDELVEALAQEGAQDYLVKGRFDGEALQRAIISARERHELLRTLHEREQQLKTILENTPDVVARFDGDGRCLYVNQALERTLGIPRATLLGNSPGARGVEQLEVFLAPIEEVFENGEARELQRRIETSLGARWLHTHFVPELDEHGEVGSVLATSRDETRRVQAQEALEKTAAALRERVKESECIYAVSRVLYDSETVAEALERVAALLPPAFLYPEIAGSRVEVEGDSRRSPGFVESVWTLRQEIRVEGEVIGLVEVSYSEQRPDQAQGDGPFLLEERMLLGAVAERIEEAVGRARARRALAESEAQLRQSRGLEAMGQLAGGIAHDFNNLLTAISGYTELLLMRVEEEDFRAYLEQVRDAAAKAGHLTSQLLAFGRRQVLQLEVLDLGHVLETTRQMLGRVVGEGVRLDLALPEEPLWIEADRGQMEKALVGLGAFVRGGTPAVSTMTLRLETGGGEDGPEAMLVIEDDGPELGPEVCERLFEPFYTSRELGRGWGLGLASVQGIVAQSGGRIVVDASPQGGCRFEIRFPVVEGATKASVSIDAEERFGSPEAGTVLVVEDDQAVRKLVARVLEHQGYTVVTADDGLEGLRKATSLRRELALVVTDVVMPRMRGPELARKLVGIAGEVPILFMSGYAEESLDAELSSDSRAFLRKPFTNRELLAHIGRLLCRDSGRAGEVA